MTNRPSRWAFAWLFGALLVALPGTPLARDPGINQPGRSAIAGPIPASTNPVRSATSELGHPGWVSYRASARLESVSLTLG